MSDIRALYTYLAGRSISVTINGSPVTPTAYDLDKLPDAVSQAMLPCRLLLPMAPKGEGRNYSFLALGNTTNLTWHITDLMLWRPADTGIGLEDIAPVLIDYAAAYAEMLRVNRAMGQRQCHLIGARFQYGTFQYPESDAGLWFDGCAVELDMEEVLSG